MEILKRVIYRIESLGVNEVASETKLSKGMVSKYFALLIKNGILRRLNGEFGVLDNVYVRSLKMLLNLSSIDHRVFRRYGFVRGAGLYGSFVRGMNTEESDMDLWIFIEKTDDVDLAKLTNELKRRYGNVRPLYLTEDKIKTLKKDDMVFYHSLVFGSITVYGEGIEGI
ncbi:MAG: nucleotidyltransferase domain-containing protein [Candidatus Altiarchaeota archaeon]|nr:nucleotidyltransferase domain-containing protein [Candidatus Altiarchaeota archaeon]